MKTFFTGCLTALCFSGIAQVKSDSTKKLNEVVIRPYFSAQPLIRSTGAIGVLDQTTLDKQPAGSFVSAINTISGVRMEERSPGSYRLSIRGSLLRSPFGIRNVKIYFDDFPLTDAGGNSYLNALDVSAASGIQVLKGPHSSIFGANSGGVILIQPRGSQPDSTALSLNLEGGSYGAFREGLSLNQQFNKYSLNITQAYQRSDGYRDHSAMDRKYFQTLHKWDYTKNAALKALLFYSDLHYNTPGGLTPAEYLQNPKLSRPAAGPSKSAIEQQAGIYSKTLYGGLSHNWQLSDRFKHIVSIFSSYTDFKNPFISNYEKRKEFTLGLRTFLEYEKKLTQANWKFDLGIESMETRSDISNYDNNKGLTAALKASDKLKAASSFAFAHLSIDVRQKWLFELSASANLYQYAYQSIAPVAIAERKNSFDTQFMPRAALSYLIGTQFSVRTSISKGYSAPSLAEIRASNNVINVDLQPEYGWNYEAGLRYQALNNRLLIDVTAFYYNLKNAIVRRLDQNDAGYFINAGGTKQPGLESTVSFWPIPTRTSGAVRGLQLRNTYTLSRFKFDNYIDKTNNFSGNALTGVPKTMLVSSADIQLPNQVYIFLQHSFTSQIPLNDANTAYAKKYHILQAKISWKNLRIGRTPAELFTGADNILNQRYSLGNDLNAFNDRYYNAAAKRTFYAGLLLRLNHL
ncbi:TonB-dependent receptor [Pedobacter heparinus]|uniref:TonB-dependent receptor n=1 Tax=Pedobacter heparinus (strain ATCC 13125 / DSM 2366 / CIP 104194 / JCM 7457 / NBRC 12017 / NCIMB 9290 / NRRL B-14731 / HIM 762-3) TaxID=485917 RepID=C6Y1H8_PEDHD|nr:TonB-dependent receptor [Pedobacter heparinus]ACU02954.1 TonB-dependent receptor [Pedobacter heparinus DSM 2366]